MLRSSMSVLAAEADPSLLLLQCVCLEGAGYEVRTAVDGVGALATIAELVSRLVKAHLLYVEPRLVEDPLATLGTYDL